MTPRTIRSLCVLVLAVPSFLLNAGCGSKPCTGGDRVSQLADQLEGSCCSFHTQPTDDQIDDSCKPIGLRGSGMRLAAGHHDCAKWAAECLGQLGSAARPAVPALIAALETGPNNYDTGDGVIPTRDAIARALGDTGDPRAVEPLLQALRNPRPVDAGPGAIGYASKEPVGQVAALEGLGKLGAGAAAVVPEILEMLAQPIESPHHERRFAAAAMALAGIGDPRGIPALIDQLDDPVRRVAAARALGRLGDSAAPAGPALVALITDSPDAEGNQVVRRAVHEILGRHATRDLPPNYDLQLIQLTRRVRDAAKRHGCPAAKLDIYGAKEYFFYEWDDRQQLWVRFDRRKWIDEGVVSGRATLTRDQEAGEERPFASLEGLDLTIEFILGGYCRRLESL